MLLLTILTLLCWIGTVAGAFGVIETKRILVLLATISYFFVSCFLTATLLVTSLVVAYS